MKVYVTWDPLYEEVVCVHRTEDGECDKCSFLAEERRKDDSPYFLDRKEFEVQD